MRHRRLLRALALGSCVLALWPARARAAEPATTIVRAVPFVDAKTGRLVITVGAHRADGRSVRANVEPTVAGTALPAPTRDESLREHAISGMQSSPTWRAPLALGVVYLFVKGLSEPDKRGALPIIDGITSYVRQLPERVVVYPTPYGRKRQGRASVTKDDIARIGESEPLDNDRPNLADAIRLNVSDLREDPAPLKILLVLTDGRDYADPEMERPADFAALGQELRKAGIVTQIVSFQPEVDVEQATENLRDLRDATDGFHAAVEPEGMFALLESLGQAVANTRRLEYEIPWSWRTFGGSRSVGGALVVDGRSLPLEEATVGVPGGGALLWGGLAGVFVLLAGAGTVVALRRGRSASVAPKPSDDEPADDEQDEGEFPAVLLAAHELVKRGVSSERAVDQLSARFPERMGELASADVDALPDEVFPVFHTRAGRNRLQEIKKLLAEPAGEPGGRELPARLEEILSDVAANRLKVEEGANHAVARISNRELMAFTQMKLDEVAAALRRLATRKAQLGTPKARGLTLALQDALRKRSISTVTVGWLVCATGPTGRGRTLRLRSGITVLGSAPPDGVAIGDPSLAPEHARIEQQGERFVLTAAAAPVRIDGQNVTVPRTLVDGETLELGRGQYIFKMATG